MGDWHAVCWHIIQFAAGLWLQTTKLICAEQIAGWGVPPKPDRCCEASERPVMRPSLRVADGY